MCCRETLLEEYSRDLAGHVIIQPRSSCKEPVPTSES